MVDGRFRHGFFEPRSVNIAHRIRRIEEQIEDDLLKLYAIAVHERKIFCKICLKNDLTTLQLAA